MSIKAGHFVKRPVVAPGATGITVNPESGSGRNPPNRLRTAHRVSTMMATLMVLSSVGGLLITALYQDPPATSAFLRASDLVTLVVAVPALLVASMLGLRGSVRAQLMWAGMLAYSVYTYAFYAFGTVFNDLFLLHVALFSMSGFALALIMVNLDVDEIAHRFKGRTPVRTISGLLFLLAVPIGAIWVFFSLRLAITGQLPPETLLVQPLPAVHLAYVLDLALLVPSYVLAAVLLWRRMAWGFVAATVLLVSGLVQQLNYMAALAFQSQADVPGATVFDPQEPIIVLVYLIALALLLVNLPRRAR